MRDLLTVIVSTNGLVDFRFMSTSSFEFRKSKDGMKGNFLRDG